MTGSGVVTVIVAIVGPYLMAVAASWVMQRLMGGGSRASREASKAATRAAWAAMRADRAEERALAQEERRARHVRPAPACALTAQNVDGATESGCAGQGVRGAA